MRRGLALLSIAVSPAASAGCPSDTDDTPEPRPAPTLIAPADAAPQIAGITEIRGYDPSNGMHLDDDDSGGVAVGISAVRPRSRRRLEILLRSTPPGATAVVDGQVVGRTPHLWEGEFTGREREFTFVLPGHGLGRYVFVPTTNGIVHARLSPVMADPMHGAGVAIPVPAAASPPEPPAPKRPVAAPVDARSLDLGGGGPSSDAGEASPPPPPAGAFGPAP